jgi:hypothetical protein
MRRVVYALVVVVISLSVSGAPRGGRDLPIDKSHPIVKMVKKMVKSLGDGLTIPGSNPSPKP